MLTGSMRPSARSSASDMGSYAACSLLVGLMAGSEGGVSLCSASSRPACPKISLIMYPQCWHSIAANSVPL